MARWCRVKLVGQKPLPETIGIRIHGLPTIGSFQTAKLAVAVSLGQLFVRGFSLGMFSPKANLQLEES